MIELELPEKFLERIKMIFGEKEIERIKLQEEKKTIRVNTIKTTKEKLVNSLVKKGFKIKEFSWYENGLLIDGEGIAKTVEYFLGYYYIQEAASMIPPIVLDPKPKENILDMCASPGSKTTQIAMMMSNKGLIIANDQNFERLKPLAFNLQKQGVRNCIVTNYDARSFWKFGYKFDKILLDAPCSNSGIIFKNESVRKIWNLKAIERLSKLQKKLIESAYKCLKENGVLVYSTCSFEPEENEEVIQYAIENFDFVVEKISIPKLKVIKPLSSWYGKKFDRSIRKAIRIIPHKEITEGFFVCKLRKC